MAVKKTKEDSFENEIENLENIVSKLEEGNVSLDEAFSLFEKGIGITKKCSKMLEGYERKVMIVKSGKNLNTKEEERLELFDE